jgi:hypothetical protein
MIDINSPARIALISTRIAEDLRGLGRVCERHMQNIADYYATSLDHVRSIYAETSR